MVDHERNNKIEAGQAEAPELEQIQDISRESNLTRSQFLIWLGQTLAPDAPLYNMIQTFTFDEALNVDAFQSAFQALIGSSDALRTVIHEVDGVPQQRVLESLSYKLECVDLSGQPAPDRAYQSWLDERRVRMHDMGTRLFDTALIQLGPARFIWYLNQHHLITDGWSFVLVYRRMADLYQQALAVELSPQVDLPAYSDYVRHERAFRETPSFVKAERYWAEKLAAPSQPLTFYDRAPRTPTHRTERVVCDLGEERTTRLKSIAAEKGIQTLNAELSLYNLLVAIFVAYLHRIGGNSNIPLGSPFHNRPSPAFKETIGVFIEVCSLRLEVVEDDTFMTLLRKVMRENMNVLMNALPGTSRAEYNRAYEVLLNFVNVTFPPFAGLQPEVEWVHSGYGDRDHALRLQIHDFNGTGSYKLHFDFNTHVFTAEQRELAVQHFLRVVDAFLENREQLIRRVDLLTSAERARFLEAFNQTRADYPADQTIIHLFETQVERTPHAPALRLGETRLTYSELNARASQLAHHLRGMGVGAESLVAISMEHSLDVVIAILGVLKAGGAYVPIDPAYPPERARVILEDLGQSPILITQPHLRVQFAGLNVRLLTVEDISLSGEASMTDPLPAAAPGDLAYVIYTSGSTGKPKGVMIEHRSLVNYIWWASGQYLDGQVRDFPLFSSLSFDLTVTSIFTPLITGGQIVVYPEDSGVRGMSILKVIEEGAVDIVKLTPGHLTLIRDMDFSRTRIKAFIVGGEDFKTELARSISSAFNHQVSIYNEYGPTEATVGCMIQRFDPAETALSVPVGIPAANAQIYVLDSHLNPVPTGVIGEMYIGGDGLARGYLNRPELTAERFIPNPFGPGTRLYKTGDLARWTTAGTLEFLGRADHQVKVGGARIELGEIEFRLAGHPQVTECVVTVVHTHQQAQEGDLRYCTRCGLASNFPGVSYDGDGVCHLCRAYDSYKDRAQAYFKPMTELQALFESIKTGNNGEYDCLALFSGGKDSTYMLAQLAAAGLKVLAFTLDNGYISEEAKANIRRVAATLKVDHIFGSTPAMNAIFVDSLKQFSNVCNGCFKTIYTLAVNLAREKGIRHIVTGLSRGQFFETRLTAEVFQTPGFDVKEIDNAILAARKAYHRRDDVISRELDVDAFRSDALFEDIQFVDFYRYCNVSLGELYEFLDRHVPWVRPSDTGRSTNCLINELGIYLHKKQRGHHSYALPYSWDVRMGHKQREEALEELQDEIDEAAVKRMMQEIGYAEPDLSDDPSVKRLAAYYVSDTPLTTSDLRAYLNQHLPDFMLPSYFIRLESLPLTRNGKIDRAALPDPQSERPELASTYKAPDTPLETQLAAIWSKALQVGGIGVNDNFFELGGSSLPALQVIYQVNQRFGVEMPVPRFFENPTIRQMSAQIEDLLIAQLAGMSDEEAASMLAAIQQGKSS